jgi:hypothetical protein
MVLINSQPEDYTKNAQAIIEKPQIKKPDKLAMRHLL